MQQKIIIIKFTYGAPLAGAPLLYKKKITNGAPLASAPLLYKKRLLMAHRSWVRHCYLKKHSNGAPLRGAPLVSFPP